MLISYIEDNDDLYSDHTTSVSNLKDNIRLKHCLFYTIEEICKQPGTFTLKLEIVEWQIKMRQLIKNVRDT